MTSLGQKLAAAMADGRFAFAFGPLVGPGIQLDRGMMGPPHLAFPQIYGYEVLGRPDGVEPKDIGRAFEEFHKDSSLWPVIPAFIEKQIRAARGHKATINLSPVYLGDVRVQKGLRAVLTPRHWLFWRTAAYAGSITLEVMESARLDESGLAFLKEIRDAGYGISIDDLGSGAHADPEYVRQLVHELTPYELKLDFNIVRGKSPSEVRQLCLDWSELVIKPCYSAMTVSGKWPTLVVEGVPVCPVADWLKDGYEVGGEQFYGSPPHKNGNPVPVYVTNTEQAPAWRQMMETVRSEIESDLEKNGWIGARLFIIGQLAPVDSI